MEIKGDQDYLTLIHTLKRLCMLLLNHSVCLCVCVSEQDAIERHPLFTFSSGDIGSFFVK